ncbi:MAG: fumarylacetoacetate hydrolase family protein [Acidobacteriaceae bacterium]
MAEFRQSTFMLSGAREKVLMETADTLSDARRTGMPVLDLPTDRRPASMEEAYAVQDMLAEAYGEIGGWKVGAPSAEGTPMFAPMPKLWMAEGGAVVRARRYRGLEAEVAFLLGRDLPPRSSAYTRDEVVDAIASCPPAIEVIDSGLTDPTKAERLSMIADLQMHGGFVYGPACADWRQIDWTQETVTLAVDGAVRVERTGSNTAGDLMRLLPWLANEGSVRTGGLRAGQWITTGSWTGNTLAEERSSVDVSFRQLGRVTLRFEPEQELEKGLPGESVRRFS